MPHEDTSAPDRADEEFTKWLRRWSDGDEYALARLMPVAYTRLKQISQRLLRQEWHHDRLETTELVHETYLRMAGLQDLEWQERAHFFAMCARMMRRILVDEARARNRLKRGGTPVHLTTGGWLDVDAARPAELDQIDDALRELARLDPERAQIVVMRFFGGMDREDIAEVLGLSSATVTRRWRSARAWLVHHLHSGSGGSGGST